MNLVPELDVVEQRGLVEIHEAAVVVHLLPLVLLCRVESVVVGLHGPPGPVQGLDDGPVLPDLHNPAEDEACMGVPHPHLVPLHYLTFICRDEINLLSIGLSHVASSMKSPLHSLFTSKSKFQYS